MKKMLNNLSRACLLATFFMASISIRAEEFNLENEDYFKEAKSDNTFITTGGQSEDDTLTKSKIDEEDKGTFYLSEEGQDVIGKIKKKAVSQQVPPGVDAPPLLEGEVKEGLDPRHHSSIRVQDSVGVPQTYSNISNSEMIKKVAWKTNSAFGLTYFALDNFEYHDSTNLYNRVFRDGQNNKNSGLLLLSSSVFLARGFLDLKMGINVGAKFNSGHGLFPDGTPSETRFSLWSIPVDLAFGMDIPISRFLKFSASAGPSVLGLIQSRNDRDYSEEGKHTRQIGTGYFASAQALIGLSSIFPKYGVDLFTDYSIGQTQLSFEGRMVKYQNFKDDITVDGTSYGVGIIFEFL